MAVSNQLSALNSGARVYGSSASFALTDC